MSLDGGNDDRVLALWTFAFLARVLLVNADEPATVWTGESDHGLPPFAAHIYNLLVMSPPLYSATFSDEMSEEKPKNM